MQLLRDLALQYVGIPYKWNSKNPVSGFDCSGLVSELLKSCGVLPHRADLNAQGLYDLFEKSGPVGLVQIGDLAFYGTGPQAVDHVAFCLDPCRMVEAGGGDHTTLLIQDAAAKNACVRIRPIHFRADFLTIFRPDYSKIGSPQA